MSIEERIGYKFKNGDLLQQALTHPSIINKPNNQRLEFLGDAVLGLIVTQILYELYPTEQEGELARRRAALVCREMLAQVARSLNLGETLHMGVSEIQSSGHDNNSNLEDAMEALIGAMFLDGGLEAARAFLTPRWRELAQHCKAPPKDAKTALQEWAQSRGLPIPVYALLHQSGPAHAPEFTIEVTVQGYPPQQAKASSKRAAEQTAATALLTQLQDQS